MGGVWVVDRFRFSISRNCVRFGYRQSSNSDLPLYRGYLKEKSGHSHYERRERKVYSAANRRLTV